MENMELFDYVENFNNEIDFFYKALGSLNATAVLLSRKNSIRDESVELRSLECAIDVLEGHLKSVVSLVDKLSIDGLNRH